MSNNSLDVLDELLSKLSKSEKRLLSIHIKLSNKHGNIKYLEYLEWVISGKELKNKKGNWNTKQEHNYKTEAIDYIIETLQKDASADNKENVLKQKLQKAQFFYNKGIFKAANIIAGKVYDEAKILGYYDIIIEALQLKEKLWITIQEEKAGFSIFLEQLTQIQQAKKEAIDNFLLYEELFSYQRKLFAIIRKDRYARDFANLPKAIEITGLPIIHKAIASGEFKIQFLGNSILAIYFISTGFPEKSYDYFKSIILLYQQHQQHQKANVKEYIVQIYNFVLNAHRIRKYDEFFNVVMNEFQQLTMQYGTHLSSYYCMYLVWKTATVDINGLKEITKEIEKNYAEKKISFQSAYIEADLYFDMFQAYFIIKDFDRALKWINLIIYNERFKKIADIYSISRLLQLLVHWELKNILLLDSLLSSVKREMLLQKKNLLVFEKIFLKYFSKMLKKKNIASIKNVAEKWHSEVIEIRNIPEENSLMNYFDFPEWIESVFSGKPFAEILAKTKS